MAVKFSELSKKLKMTNLELRRAIKKLGIDVGPRQAMLRKETAEEILEKIGYQKKAKGKSKKAKPQAKIKKLKENQVEIPKVMTVKEFASLIRIPVSEVITALMKNGLMVTINESIDYETAAIIASEFGLEAVEEKGKTKELPEEYLEKKENLKSRPPVVVIMGHVDHGKTTLLDSIRKTEVVAGESGGITQHIGAYRVQIKNQKSSPEAGQPRAEKIKNKKTDRKLKISRKRTITFLDTPGHEAFTMMRAHGGRLADLAILVVAANDGVKPQTIEAIEHLKSAGVPIVVAINKIDAPGADPEKVKKELSESGLPVEGWGGNTPAVPISAKTGKNIKELLEVLLLVADMNDFKADKTGPARGTVIESHMQRGSGPLATILVQKGVLNQGDVLVAGDSWGKIKRMEDENAKRLKEASPSRPVRVLGLYKVARFGDLALEVKTEKEAKELIREEERKKAAKKITEIGIAAAAASIRKGETKVLQLIIKTDVAGSLKAIKDSVLGLSTKDVKIDVVGQGVGEVTVSDIELAKATGAVIIAFNVRTNISAKKLALQEKIKISNYSIIYQLIDEVAAALEGLLEPEIIEEDTGKGRILAIFKHHRRDKIIGAKITSGYASVGTLVRIKREGKLLGEAEIKNLQQADVKAEKVEAGAECGLNIVGEVEAKKGDRLEFYKKVEKVRKIKR